MADVPTKSVYVTDFGEIDVPIEWELKFARAEVEDYRNGRTFLWTHIPSWEARRAVERAFEAEFASKLEAV